MRTGRGLGPLVAAGPKKVCRPPRVDKEVVGPKKEEGEEKGRVILLTLGLFGGECGF